MSKSKAVAKNQVRPKRGKRSKLSSLWVYVLGGGLVLTLVVGLSAYFTQSRESSPATGLPASDAPLSMAAVGKPAPGFSLQNRYTTIYTLTPGDGKNHVLVFYMGNF